MAESSNSGYATPTSHSDEEVVEEYHNGDTLVLEWGAKQIFDLHSFYHDYQKNKDLQKYAQELEL